MNVVLCVIERQEIKLKAIIDKKVYDTEKAERVRTLYRNVKVTGVNLLGVKMTKSIGRECDLYLTPKGNWFEHRKKIESVWDSKEELVLVSAADVKDTFEQLGDVENYEKYFERLEQA